MLWRWTVRAFACFGLFSALVLMPPPLSFLAWWNDALAGTWGPAGGDTLIVLGAEEVEGGILGLHSYWRTVYGVYEWRQNRYKTLILSGAGVAPLMRDYAVAHGVPAEAIRLEEASKSTRDQGEFVAEMLRASTPSPGRVVLVTSDYHSRRATAVFRRYGLVTEPHPVPDAGKRLSSWAYRWEVFADLSLESVKTGYYKWKDWLK